MGKAMYMNFKYGENKSNPSREFDEVEFHTKS